MVADGTYVVRSEVLGLELCLRPDGTFRFIDPATGQVLLTHEEETIARQAAVVRAEAAEARVAELEALLSRLSEGQS
jgi:hypothetical protein